MQPITFFACADIVVTGSNAEAADCDNPRGHIFGSASYVVAESARGDRRRLHVKTAHSDAEALAPAQRMADALVARLARGLLPVAFATWADTRPAYGSEAYVEYGQDEDLALERLEAEDAAY